MKANEALKHPLPSLACVTTSPVVSWSRSGLQVELVLLLEGRMLVPLKSPQAFSVLELA